jgi:hypothetical protein
MGGRARSLIRWLRHHRSRRVSSSSASSSSSSHLTNTTTTASTDLRAHSLPQQPGQDGVDDADVHWEVAAGGPDSDPEDYIVIEENKAGGLRVVVPRAPVRTKPPRMDPGKKVRSFAPASFPSTTSAQ